MRAAVRAIKRCGMLHLRLPLSAAHAGALWLAMPVYNRSMSKAAQEGVVCRPASIAQLILHAPLRPQGRISARRPPGSARRWRS